MNQDNHFSTRNEDTRLALANLLPIERCGLDGIKPIDPIRLPCGHVYCRVCVQDIATTASLIDQEPPICKVCGQPFQTGTPRFHEVRQRNGLNTETASTHPDTDRLLEGLREDEAPTHIKPDTLGAKTQELLLGGTGPNLPWVSPTQQVQQLLDEYTRNPFTQMGQTWPRSGTVAPGDIFSPPFQSIVPGIETTQRPQPGGDTLRDGVPYTSQNAIPQDPTAQQVPTTFTDQEHGGGEGVQQKDFDFNDLFDFGYGQAALEPMDSNGFWDFEGQELIQPDQAGNLEGAASVNNGVHDMTASGFDFGQQNMLAQQQAFDFGSMPHQLASWPGYTMNPQDMFQQHPSMGFAGSGQMPDFDAGAGFWNSAPTPAFDAGAQETVWSYDPQIQTNITGQPGHFQSPAAMPAPEPSIGSGHNQAEAPSPASIAVSTPNFSDCRPGEDVPVPQSTDLGPQGITPFSSSTNILTSPPLAHLEHRRPLRPLLPNLPSPAPHIPSPRAPAPRAHLAERDMSVFAGERFCFKGHLPNQAAMEKAVLDNGGLLTGGGFRHTKYGVVGPGWTPTASWKKNVILVVDEEGFWELIRKRRGERAEEMAREGG